MKIFWMTLAVIFLPLHLIASDDPEPELIVPTGLEAVKAAIVMHVDSAGLTVYSGKPDGMLTPREDPFDPWYFGVMGEDYSIDNEARKDIDGFMKLKTRALLTEKQGLLKVGESYFVRFATWKTGEFFVTTDDNTEAFIFDGSIPDLTIRIDFTLYYTPLKSRAVWVKVYHHSGKLQYESANGAPPYCNLVNLAGNGYLYLPSDILTARNTGKIQLFYDEARTVMKEVVVKNPKMRVIPLKETEYRLLANGVRQKGVRVIAVTLANEEVAVEATEDFKSWRQIGVFTTDKFGWGEVEYFGPPGFFRAHTVK